MEIEKEFETIKYMDRLINLENSKKALQLYKLPKDIRPCISNLLLTEVAKGDYPDRKRVGLFIAVELRRIGFKDSCVFRPHPDTIPVTSGQHNGSIRTA